MSNTSKKATKATPATRYFKDESRSPMPAGGGSRVPARAIEGERSSKSLLDRAKAARDSISDEENAAIIAAARADPDAQPNLAVRRGRPPLQNAKIAILLRLDPDVIESFKASGTGWQTRMNLALRKAAGLD